MMTMPPMMPAMTPKGGAAEHPEHANGDDAEHGQSLAERPKNKGADVVEHRLRTGAARHGLGERQAWRNEHGGGCQAPKWQA